MSPWFWVRTLGQGSLGTWRCLRMRRAQSVFLSDGFRVERGAVPSSLPGPWLGTKSGLLQARPLYIYLGLAALTLHPTFSSSPRRSPRRPPRPRPLSTSPHGIAQLARPNSVSSRSGAGMACPDSGDSLACAIGLPPTYTTPSMRAGHASEDTPIVNDLRWLSGAAHRMHLSYCT